MRTKLLLLTVACLVFFSERGHSQPTDTPQNDYEQLWLSPKRQLETRKSSENFVRSYWEGQGVHRTVLEALECPSVRSAWSVSEEQFQQFNDSVNASINTPEALDMFNKLDGAGWSYDSDDEETRRRFEYLAEQSASLLHNARTDALDSILTQEQKQIIDESLLSSLGETPIVSPSMFEVLNLTDTQRQEMERIKKEFETAFEEMLEDYVNSQMILSNKWHSEVARQDNPNRRMSREELQERNRAVFRKLMSEDREYKSIHEDIQSKSIAFTERFKVEIFDVLTDEQWARLQDLIDNPPRHARIFIAKLREQRGVTEENKGNVWVPGPGSWQPGDPIPESYRIQRNTRGNFPRPANQ